MFRFFLFFVLEPALSVLLTKLHGLRFKIQTMCGMPVWMKKQVNAFWGGKEKGMKILRQSDFVGEL